MDSEFKICPNCFTQNEVNTKFCNNCGFDLDGENLDDFNINVFYNIDDLVDDAVLMYKAEDYETSLEFIEFYLEDRANNSYAWSFKAHILNKLGFINDAISCCDFALNIDDMCEVAWMSKAYFYNLLKNDNACFSCCEACLILNSQNEYILKLKESVEKKLDG